MMELETEAEADVETATDADPAETAPDVEAEPVDESRYDTSSLGPVVGPIESDMFAGFRGGIAHNYAIWTGYAVTALIAVGLFIGSRALPAKPATLLVTTSPPDVTLIVDGTPVAGRSPFRLDDLIPEGDHVIEVRRAGFESTARRVSLAPGEIRTLREVALVPVAPQPAVDSAPLDAEDPP